MIKRTKPKMRQGKSMQNPISRLKKRGLKGTGASGSSFTLGFTLGFMA